MKQVLIIITLFFSTVTFSYSQGSSEPAKKVKKGRFYKQPVFPGGARMLTQYLSQNITYPQEAVSKRIQGKVYAEFTVEKDGTITNVKIHRGIGGGCDEETIRVIKSMPKWIPAEQKGTKIKVKHALPVQFYLPRKKRK